MASAGSNHLKDIDEQFFQCPICLQQCREPKQLPCLHRYCSECLKKLIIRNQELTVIHCPECGNEFALHKEGVDGFQIDFDMENIFEYIQLQELIKNEHLQECHDCSKKVKMTAYCLRCNGYLCKECHKSHMTDRTLRHLKQHVLSLEGFKLDHIMLKKPADSKKTPGCKDHPKDLCRLCCRTCDNLPICSTCTNGSHKNHDINDVGIVATEEKEKLQSKLKNISQNSERMLKMPQTVDRIKEELISNVREKKEEFTVIYEREVETVKEEIKKIEDDYELQKTEIENNKKRELMEARRRMEEEMRRTEIKYENIFNEIQEESRLRSDNLNQEEEEDDDDEL